MLHEFWADSLPTALLYITLLLVNRHAEWVAAWCHAGEGAISLEESMSIAGRLGGALPAGVAEAVEAVARNVAAALDRERALAEEQRAAGEVAMERIAKACRVVMSLVSRVVVTPPPHTALMGCGWLPTT